MVNVKTNINKIIFLMLLLLSIIILTCDGEEPIIPEHQIYINPTDIDLQIHPAGYQFTDSFMVKNVGEIALSCSLSKDVSWITDLCPTYFSLELDQECIINLSGIFPAISDSFSTNIGIISDGDSQNVSIHGFVGETFQDEISFSGYKWFVKSSDSPVGPGPNDFSNSSDNVWIDKDGQLHLRITNRDEKWYCAEVGTKESFGYGKYVFTLESRVDNINENVVLGLFTWSNAPEYNHREIDIEFTRWEDQENDNAQFVVQPWSNAGNVYRFNVKNLGVYQSTSSFNWQSDYISFLSIYGQDYATFSYAGKDIPVPGDENVRINLWLVWGHPPSDSNEVEIVVKKFEFIP